MSLTPEQALVAAMRAVNCSNFYIAHQREPNDAELLALCPPEARAVLLPKVLHHDSPNGDCAGCLYEGEAKGRREAIEESARIAESIIGKTGFDCVCPERIADMIRTLAAEGDAASVEGGDAHEPDPSRNRMDRATVTARVEGDAVVPSAALGHTGAAADSSAASAPSSPPPMVDIPSFMYAQGAKRVEEAAMLAARAMAAYALDLCCKYVTAQEVFNDLASADLAAIVRGALRGDASV